MGENLSRGDEKHLREIGGKYNDHGAADLGPVIMKFNLAANKWNRFGRKLIC